MSQSTALEATSNTKQTTPKLTHADLRAFCGGLARYRSPLNRTVIYTPGIQFLIEKAHAYWLLDAIISYFGSEQMQRAMIKDYRVKSMQFWRLDVTDEAGVLTARADDGVTPFVRQEIVFTDFPLEYVDIWAGYDGEYWTLYLPSEH